MPRSAGMAKDMRVFFIALITIGAHLVLHQHKCYLKNDDAQTNEYMEIRMNTPHDPVKSYEQPVIPTADPVVTDNELETFLNHHPNTPGAKFIKLWHFQYRGTATEEIRRFRSCKSSGSRSRPSSLKIMHCFAGSKGYTAHLQLPEPKPPLGVPLWETQPETINTDTIWSAENGTKEIASLGTYPSCIALLLAGYAAHSTRPAGVVVELGPFAGFSSRCIVAGMAKHGHVPYSYFAFDTFEGHANYNAISQLAPWSTEDKEHTFSAEHTDFLFVWETAVKDIYPEAQGRKGSSSKNTINYNTLGNKSASMISIDSAKDPLQFVKQQEGLLPIQAGTIWFLMDFLSVETQPLWVYGCMREYVMPVFASMEQWAFVVKKDIDSLRSPRLVQCFEDIQSDIPKSLLSLKRQMESDFATLLGFDQEGMPPNELTYLKNKLIFKSVQFFNSTKTTPWIQLAQAAKG